MCFWKRLKQIIQSVRSQCSSDPLEQCRRIRFPATLQNRSDKPKDVLARAGEEAAVSYLEANGLAVLHRNLRFPEGELDIVAKWERTVVFVEVKTRQNSRFGQPFSAVSPEKQRRLTAAANRFLSIVRLRNFSVRFDVVSVVMETGLPPKIEHIKNAFLVNEL